MEQLTYRWGQAIGIGARDDAPSAVVSALVAMLVGACAAARAPASPTSEPAGCTQPADCIGGLAGCTQPADCIGGLGPARAAATTASVKLAPAKSGAGAPVGHTTVLAGTRATARRRSPACSTSARDATVMKTAVSACVSRAIAAAVRVRATPTPTARWTKSVTCSAAPSRREGNLRMLSDTVPIRAIVVSSTLGAHCARTPVARVRIS